jgi:hypothetical protein
MSSREYEVPTMSVMGSILRREIARAEASQ